MMKFIVSSQLLFKNLQNISGIIVANKSVPIVENILFSIHGMELLLTATDLETTMVARVELSQAEGEGSVAIPAKLVVETLKTLPDVPMVFTVSDEGNIEIVADNAHYSFVGFDAAQYPKVPEMGEEKVFSMPVKYLCNAISKTNFATGSPEIRPVMAGIFCQVEQENIVFVATDGHRMVKYECRCSDTGISDSLILPKKPLLQLKNVLQNVEGDIRINFNSSQVSFSIQSLTVISKLVEGRYPNYASVIPQNNTNKLRVERMQWLQKLRNIAMYSNQSTHQVRLSISSSVLTLSAEDRELANKAVVTMPCQYEGEPLNIGFSSKYLQEFLSNLDTAEVLFLLSHATGPGLLFPVNEGGEEEKEKILMLAMPVMLSTE